MFFHGFTYDIATFKVAELNLALECLYFNSNTNGPLDINECLRNSTICGLGTCTNNDGGLFYECDCQDGAVTTGSNSDGSLTCVGEFHNFHLPLSIESLLYTRYQ